VRISYATSMERAARRRFTASRKRLRALGSPPVPLPGISVAVESIMRSRTLALSLGLLALATRHSPGPPDLDINGKPTNVSWPARAFP